MKKLFAQESLSERLRRGLARSLSLVPILLLALCIDSCSKEEHLKVRPAQLQGLWQKSNTQEYWRFKEDATGVTWDEAEDVTEEESNMTFEWSISHGDELTCIFRGEMGNQAVPKLYVIKEISETRMKWEDYYGITYTYKKAGR